MTACLNIRLSDPPQAPAPQSDHCTKHEGEIIKTSPSDYQDRHDLSFHPLDRFLTCYETCVSAVVLQDRHRSPQ
jgi:hypothetical protein